MASGIGRQLISSVASGVQKAMARRVVAEYADAIRRIDPDKLRVLVENDLSLKPILDNLPGNRDVRDDIIVQILKLDPVTVVDVLCDVHPGLRPVLDNDKGIAWLRVQGEDLRKR